MAAVIRRIDETESGSAYPALWEVDMTALFEFAVYALERHEVEALADWIDMVCGGSSDRSDELREAMEVAVEG